MAAKMIYGEEVARGILGAIERDISELREKDVFPGLATILVDNDEPSKIGSSMIFLKKIETLFKHMNVYFESHLRPKDVSEYELIGLIHALNDDPKITGILLIYPVPDHLDFTNTGYQINKLKDVDGLNWLNNGSFVSAKDIEEMQKRNIVIPCAALGILQILNHMGITLQGENVTIVGRGWCARPIITISIASDATVTICSSKTRNLKDETQRADILFSVTGKPKLITGDMVKEGAVVIDVGINRSPEGKIVGDVDFDSVKEKASYITPVPGGIGPMTVTMLLKNLIELTKKSNQIHIDSILYS